MAALGAAATRLARSGRRRIAHANVERADKPDPRISELANLMGKGFILPAPVLPSDRYRSIVLPTPKATTQTDLPLGLKVYDACGKEAATVFLGKLPRDHADAVDVNTLLNGTKLPSGYGHVELLYNFRDGGSADGWLHALFRYEDRRSGHAAETSFGAHVFNTALTYKSEPQSYVGRPPGLSTRLFLRLGTDGLDTLCHLIYPASTIWAPHLIAMRPDKQLASLLGLSDAGGTLANAYLQLNSTQAAASGLVTQTIQYHGAADRYNLNGAGAVATLYSNATTATPYPAVTLRSVGTNGGQAAAFSYDLARSVVFTRQGNPAWTGQDRDGDGLIRSDDLFYGNASYDPQSDWINFDKVAIPQADEQQRLLANLITQMNLDRKPLPHFWYFPHGKKAVVVMTGDDHGYNGSTGTAGRFDQYLASIPAGCSVADWECIRSTSYIYPTIGLTDAQAASYAAQGFEIALHVKTLGANDCDNYTQASLDGFFKWSARGQRQSPSLSVAG